jgi:translation elongation factor EF-1beta
MSSIVIRNAELFWAKLDQPVNPFNAPQPHWELQIRTRDKAEAKVWRDTHKLRATLKEDGEGSFYQVNLKRKAFTKDGIERDPVKVVDAQLMPVDGGTLGNGSIGNVQIDTYTYKMNGQEDIGFSLKAVQVMKLVEYKGGNGLAFEAEGETEVVIPADTNTDDSEW